MRKYLLLLALCGCDSATGTSVNSLDDFENQVIQFDCDFLLRCCGTAWATAKYGDPANCAPMGQAATAQSIMKTDAQIAAGVAQFDSAAAGACLDWMIAGRSTCNGPINDEPNPCRYVTHGLLPVGATCGLANGASCAPDLRCGDNGTCVALPTTGQACDLTYGCARGVYCLPSGLCGAQLAAGQPCQTNAQCISDNCPFDTQVCSASLRQFDTTSICK